MGAGAVLRILYFKKDSNMLSKRIVENIYNNVKEVIMETEGLIEGGLNPESASQVSEVLNDLASPPTL
ncbi:hypothetical protein MNBD_PLANCTO02-3173 [hydrothermal vent metagenome]|uniref:Uncharacterized protein n=1 Tax=hydrothermal vent metagenome TaxID=652676 RepID=A0A3B1DZF5_9ZZZZ